MARLIDYSLGRGNDDTEPELLIIHCPRVVQVTPWCDWAAEMLITLKGYGWIERRMDGAVHIITPLHPAVMQ